MNEPTSPDDIPGLSLERSIPLTGIPEAAPVSFRSLIVDGDGRFWTTDEFNHRILVFSPDGVCERVVGGQGSGEGQFWYPAGMALVGDEIWVCDSWNHRVQRFALDGSFVGTFGSIGADDHQFDEPVAVAPLPDGRVAILDRGNCRIRVVDRQGKPLATWGERGTWSLDRDGVTEAIIADGVKGMVGDTPLLQFPMDMVACREGLLIADTCNHRLMTVSFEGTALDVYPGQPLEWPNRVTSLSDNLWLIGGINIPSSLFDHHERHRLETTTNSGVRIISAVPRGDGNVVCVAEGEMSFASYHIDEYLASSSPPKGERELLSLEGWAMTIAPVQAAWLLSRVGDATFEEVTVAFIARVEEACVGLSKSITEGQAHWMNLLVQRMQARVRRLRSPLGSSDEEEAKAFLTQTALSLDTLRSDNEIQNALFALLIALMGRLGKSWPQESRPHVMAVNMGHRLDEDISSVRSEFEKTVEILKRNLENPATLSLEVGIHATAGMVFLADAERRLVRLFDALPGALLRESTISLDPILEIERGSVLLENLESRILSVLIVMCGEEKRTESIVTLCRFALSLWNVKATYVARDGALLLSELGEHEKGIALLEEALRCDPKDQIALFQLAKLSRDVNATSVYRSAVERIQSRGNPDARALAALFGTLDALDAEDGALAVERMMPLLEPEVAQTTPEGRHCALLMQAAGKAFSLGLVPLARVLYRRLKRKQTMAGVVGEGNALFLMGYNEEVISLVDDSLSATNARAAMLKTDALLVSGRIGEAEKLWRASRETMSSWPTDYLIKGAQIDLAAGLLGEALAKVENASDVTAKDPKTLGWRALLLCLLDDERLSDVVAEIVEGPRGGTIQTVLSRFQSRPPVPPLAPAGAGGPMAFRLRFERALAVAFADPEEWDSALSLVIEAALDRPYTSFPTLTPEKDRARLEERLAEMAERLKSGGILLSYTACGSVMYWINTSPLDKRGDLLDQ